MSLGYRLRARLEGLPHDLKNYRAPRPPYSERVIWALQLVGALFLGYALVVCALSLS